MAGTAIVLIPKDSDPVWDVSSEKVPHMTILFLGDQSNADELSMMQEYVRHVAATTLSPMFIVVDHRGILGKDKADVLYFQGPLKDLQGARRQMLADTNIFRAFSSVEQFPGWTPHLTLGYPETPAKSEFKKDWPGVVEFDRIAIWTGDFIGPTYTLTHGIEKGGSLMSESFTELEQSEVVQDFLSHFGTKGMKWGVRKDRGHEGEQASTRKIASLDKKFEKKATNSIGLSIKVHNRAAQMTNDNDIDRINNKPQYKNVNFNRDSPLRRKYYAEHEKAFLDNAEKAAKELGTNASGTKEYRITELGDGTWRLTLGDVKHADDENFLVKVSYDDNGYIISLAMEEPTVLEQSEKIEQAEAWLAHFGVPGMKWGVRRDRSSGSSGKSEVTTKIRPGKKVRSTGGRGLSPSEDAIKASVLKTKAKSSTSHSLSNKELQDLVTRLNLEQNYSRLADPGKLAVIKKGTTHANTILAVGTLATTAYALGTSPLGKLIASKVKAKTSK